MRKLYNVYVDTNIFVGAIAFELYKQKDFEKHYKCFNELLTYNKKLFCSSLTIAQIISMFQKRLGNEKLKKTINKIRAKFEIVDFIKKDIDDAMEDIFSGYDLEDIIQILVSNRGNCFSIVTDNKNDFKIKDNNNSVIFNFDIVPPEKIRKLNF